MVQIANSTSRADEQRYPRRNPWPPWWSRHETTIVLGEIAMLYVLVVGCTTNQPPLPATATAMGAALVAGIRVGLEERRYRADLPRARRALRRIGRAVGRLLRGRILFWDLPGHSTNPTTSIVDLARGEGPTPEWTSTEATRIRAGIERLLTAFEAEVGRQVSALPPAAARRLDVIDDELDLAAEKMLKVGAIADEMVPILWTSDRTRLDQLRAARESALETALRPLRRAVTECEWLIGAADS